MPIAEKIKKYVAAKGSRLTNQDAESIGDSLERLTGKLGRAPTVEEFSEAARRKGDPAHEVVSRKFGQLTEQAWRQAAAFCLAAVDVIYILEDGTPTQPEKAVWVLDEGEVGATGEDTGTAYQIEDVKNSAERIQLAEARCRKYIECYAADFASVAGIARARKLLHSIADCLSAQRHPTTHKKD